VATSVRPIGAPSRDSQARPSGKNEWQARRGTLFQGIDSIEDNRVRKIVVAAVLVLAGCSAAKAAPTNTVVVPGVNGTPVTFNPHPPLSTATPIGPWTSQSDGSACHPMSDGRRQCVAP